ncbi:hypothetical protein [Kaistella montana]|uniref:Peptidoglycan-binding protein LysM n=1 Tax=Kaistella montana TaxID=1849733 RepID=A0ABW5KAA9_9FLAO|nr:hypothetical protein [Kaistella montana]MCQ4036121.1 hypothetical protein [Kaistella montana]
MKKSIFIFSVIATLFSLTVNAQATSVATLNVNLYPIQTIVVNPTQTTVNLDYKTTSDYANGVNLDQKDHLEVYSTGAFAVSVKSSSTQLTNSTFSADNINSSDITITPKPGTTNPLTGATLTPKQLSTSTTVGQEIISSDLGANNATFNINYAAKGDSDNYINKYHNAQNPTVYTTTVTYTIAAK